MIKLRIKSDLHSEVVFARLGDSLAEAIQRAEALEIYSSCQIYEQLLHDLKHAEQTYHDIYLSGMDGEDE